MPGGRTATPWRLRMLPDDAAMPGGIRNNLVRNFASSTLNRLRDILQQMQPVILRIVVSPRAM